MEFNFHNGILLTYGNLQFPTNRSLEIFFHCGKKLSTMEFFFSLRKCEIHCGKAKIHKGIPNPYGNCQNPQWNLKLGTSSPTVIRVGNSVTITCDAQTWPPCLMLRRAPRRCGLLAWYCKFGPRLWRRHRKLMSGNIMRHPGRGGESISYFYHRHDVILTWIGNHSDERDF